MSADAFTLDAEIRNDTGKGASRRLRRLDEKVPCIIYGGDKPPANISITHNSLWHHLENEAFFSHVITINVDGNQEEVVIKDLQRHPAKSLLIHADFMRVDKNKALVVNVPLHFINEESCIGVKMQGGKISHQATDIEVRCLPAALPEYIEVDMADIETGQIVHLSDVKLPEGVESVALSHGSEHDLAIASVNTPKGGSDDEESGDTDGEASANSNDENKE